MRAIRVVLSAFLVSSLFFCVTAQDAQPEEPPPEQVVRSYDLSMLMLDGATPKTVDVLAPDRVLSDGEFIEEEDAWLVRNCRGGTRSFPEIHEVAQNLLLFCGSDEAGSYSVDPGQAARLVITGSDELHRRVAWMLESLTAASKVRVHVAAYTLPAGEGPITLSAVDAAKAAKDARLVGTSSGQMGETLLLQNTQAHEFIQGYSLGQDGKSLMTRGALHAGHEVLAAALPLPDGRVYLHGWSARLALAESRDVATSCGKVECPRAAYSWLPVSALIENGGAVIADEGARGRTLFCCTIEGTMPNRALECGTRTTLGLVNVSAWATPALPQMEWVSSGPISHLRLGTESQPQGLWPQCCPTHGLASALSNRLVGESATLGAILCIGPYLGVRVTESEENGATIEEFEAARKRVSELLKEISLGPEIVQLRVRAWRAKTAPALSGRGATSKDLEALGAAVFDRVLSGLVGQIATMADLELAALILGESSGPEAGTASWGTQLQWRVLASSQRQLEMRAAWIDGSRKIESVIDDGKVRLERAQRQVTPVEFNGAFESDALLQAVVPAGEGYLVVAVQRLK